MEKNDTYRSVLEQLTKKIYGTTIYIGRTEVTTIYGEFTCFTFQDLIHKGYIIALCHGDMNADLLYTRMHSSCVTSETMRSLDCDCVSQLYGALKKIAENNGILFYLIQEGRGCGYVGKSRACMNVQYYEDTDNEINTFQAYESLGMIHDYRQYNNVKEILELMGLDPTFVLLTNNPDKIEKFKDLGINLDRVESIEITPNPFNQQYLHSKEKYGHILYQAKTKVSKYIIPHEKIEPFDPYPLSNAKRFIHVSSYYLPIKPTWQKVVLTQDGFELLKSKYPDQNFPYQRLDESEFYVKLTEEIIGDNPELLCKPYWFKVNVFYDIVTHHDYLILEYGMDEDNSKVPIVRIHSESIFNRFPLTDRLYKYRYKRSLEYIVRNGKGCILILYHDGRGSGLGYYVLNSQRDEKTILTNSQEFEDTLGVEEDRRDYFGALTLLKSFSLEKCRQPIDVIHGDSSYDTLKNKMEEHSIKVRHWIDVNNQTDMFGYESIYARICQTPNIILRLQPTLNRIRSDMFDFDLKSRKFVVTGIGSSESHAKYLVSRIGLDYNIRFIPLPLVSDKNTSKSADTHLIVFSQGMSYNSLSALTATGYSKKTLITTYKYNEGDQRKDSVYLSFIKREHNNIITYPRELPDDTLIRITGPYSGYVIAESIRRAIMHLEPIDLKSIVEEIEANRICKALNYDFVSLFDQHTKLNLILADDIYSYHRDISNRFIEGTFVDTVVCKISEFAHGFYQKALNDESPIFLIVKTHNSELTNGVDRLLEGQKYFVIDLTDVTSTLVKTLTLLSVLNDAVYQIMQRLNVNQRDWPGKNTQYLMYDVIETDADTMTDAEVNVKKEKEKDMILVTGADNAADVDGVVDRLERIKQKYHNLTLTH